MAWKWISTTMCCLRLNQIFTKIVVVTVTRVLGNSSNIENFLLDGYFDFGSIKHKERIKHLSLQLLWGVIHIVGTYKIAKIIPPISSCTQSYAFDLNPLYAYVLSIYSSPLLINFYSDSGHFHFCLSLRLNFTKPISKRFLWFLFIA